jgi:hypothetical protein
VFQQAIGSAVTTGHSQQHSLAGVDGQPMVYRERALHVASLAIGLRDQSLRVAILEKLNAMNIDAYTLLAAKMR